MMTGAPLCEQAESWPALVGVTGTRDTRERREAGTGLTRAWSVVIRHGDSPVSTQWSVSLISLMMEWPWGRGERGSLVTAVSDVITQSQSVSRDQPLSRLCLILWVVSRKLVTAISSLRSSRVGSPLLSDYHPNTTQVRIMLWEMSSQSLLHWK